MGTAVMKLQWLWRRGTESLGAAGLVGLLLLGAALVAHFALLRPLAARSAALHASLLAPPQQTAWLPAAFPLQAPGSAAQLAAFELRFPRLQQLPQLLARIDEAAAAQRVDLRAGDYRLEQLPGEALLRYRFTLPLRARYAPIRSFVDQVLQQLPTAALDEIDLQRDGSDAAAPLQARLRFTLFLRP